MTNLTARTIRLGLLLLAGGLVGVMARPSGAQPHWRSGQQNHAVRASQALRGGDIPVRHSAARVPARAVGDFPPLPPDPYDDEKAPLPPLDVELLNRGGSYLYAPEGDRLTWPDPHADEHYDLLRLPEDWIEPKPFTLFAEFQGADPIHVNPKLKWPGPGGYVWEPRFVGYGGYSLFAFALEENNRRQDVIGHQLLLDLDLKLTGTERFHVQFRPLGKDNTGGSFYQFSNPEGYEDNSIAEPTRYWFEGELHSMLSAYLDPFAAMDYNVVVGKFPFLLQNALLIDDEILGVVLSKNSIYLGQLSNLNVQAFCAFNDVDAFNTSSNRLYGANVSADCRKVFVESSYAYFSSDFDASRDAHYFALSGTKFHGPMTVAGRGLFKWGDEGGRGGGQLFVLESNYSCAFHDNPLGLESAVLYCNAFRATKGWNSISGENLNRLRVAFETNPLVRIAAGRPTDNTWGVAVGAQFFRHHEDESLVPELAFEAPDDEAVWGFGFRYLRKVGSRAFFETLFTLNRSEDSRFDREGVFLAYNILF